MPKFLILANYLGEGLKGLQKDKASGRKAAIDKAAKACGGKLDVMYYALGEYDVVAIMDFPDTQSATSFCLTVSSSGQVRTRTTPLLTVAETDQALDKMTTAYRPPGR